MGPFGHDRCAGKVRQIQTYHMDTKKWSDIAYSTVVCPHGYVYEGRGWRTRTAANGTNAGNDASYAHCYLGGQGDPLTEDGKRGLVLAFHLAQVEGGAGTQRWVHRDWKATECPGDEITAFVRGGMKVGAEPSADDAYPVDNHQEDEEMIVPIEVAPGESKSFHVEPRSADGRASFLGIKDALVVLSSHSADPVSVWIWGQGPTPNTEVSVGRHPLTFHADGGWLHIHNRGAAEIGGSILYRK